MLRILITALLKDIQTLIRQEVFVVSGAKRRKKIEDYLGEKYPSVIRDYLENVEVETLRRDTIRLIVFLKHGRFSTLDFSLFKTIQRFIVQDLLTLDNDSGAPSELMRAAHILAVRGEAELEKDVTRFAKQYPGISIIRVQTATTLTPQEKKAIRMHFAYNKTLYYAIFSMDPSLFGGLRLFKDGKLFDNSWAHHISTRVHTT